VLLDNIKALNHAYKGEAAKRRILKKEVSLARKHTLEIEEQQATKRLKSKMKSALGPPKRYIYNEGIQKRIRRCLRVFYPVEIRSTRCRKSPIHRESLYIFIEIP
jgi:hypothetical protein